MYYGGMIDKTKTKSSLYDWCLTDTDGYFHLLGKVGKDDFRWAEGEPIVTSGLLRIDFEKMEAETKHTIYKLGAML